MAAAAAVPEHQEASINRHRARRSAPYAHLAAIPPMPQNTAWARMRRLYQLARPRHVWLKLLAVSGLVLAQTLVEDWSYETTGAMFAALMSRNRGQFVRLVPRSLVLAAAAGFAWETLFMLANEMGLGMCLRTETHICHRLTHNNLFYFLSNIDRRVQDIEYRLCYDADGGMAHIVDTLFVYCFRPVVKGLFFTVKIGFIAGWYFPAAMGAYYLLSIVVLKAAMPDYGWLWGEMARLESRFKSVHTRVKVCAESIAFFDGGQRERASADVRLAELMRHEWHRNFINFKLGLVQDLVQTRVPWVIQFVLRFAYGYLFGGTDAELIADRGQAVNAGQAYLMSALPQVSIQLGQSIASIERVSEMVGKVQRVAEFLEIMDEAEAAIAETSNAGAADAATYAHGSASPSPGCRGLGLSGVDIVTPGVASKARITFAALRCLIACVSAAAGVVVAGAVNVEVARGSSLMVTGRSATGKSSLVRVLAGLWPVYPTAGEVHFQGKSSVTQHGRPSLHQLCVVPQRILMATGTLADQLTYPAVEKDRGPDVEARLQALLGTVGLDYLLERYSWDHEESKWEDVLSLGEQQRIGIARMLFFAPDFAVLDECTSAVSVDQEEALFVAASRGGITTITVSQRLTLPELHTRELRIGEDNASGWALVDIEKGLKNHVASSTLAAEY
eukprot:SAG31_NODE_472_length_15237_cov_3.424891_2_plen_674_part_00